ncbi:MAG: hypothetical protein GWN99_09075 [Gemmatimonadetes bacterium]|uniref:Phosphoenolpyruvate synthase n=1 Tax=Candidatus Kutchimonas denitrificans TaxID=3056748 RepID=A0AAE4ZCG4_9BACT|nr:hypothetical protein [Gemmatimonadota bacterium]NIR76716.1 hypothetical protein [Candidatus Kutchimonas denitrificans]NIS01203.1 hypothetical protein [Gemmatimonadota bacterium]NIT68242.1 hypothetical protein [Gemmatimonadota bacterium]NIW75460.1 hypothetical protein [Gemmatimonadota bacterium]
MPQINDDEAARYVRWFSEVGSSDVKQVGGKNASLGEMTRELGEAGIRVPTGFAVTAAAYREFLEANDLPERIADKLESFARDEISLAGAGKSIRRLLRKAEFPTRIAHTIKEAYSELSSRAGKR